MGSIGKEGGVIRQLPSNFYPKFYPRTVFRHPHSFPEDVLSSRWPAVDCILYYRTGGVTGDNYIVYDFYPLAIRWTVHAKIAS